MGNVYRSLNEGGVVQLKYVHELSVVVVVDVEVRVRGAFCMRFIQRRSRLSHIINTSGDLKLHVILCCGHVYVCVCSYVYCVYNARLLK